MFFKLTVKQLEFYDKVIKAFSHLEEGGIFTGAVYYPARYKKELDEEKEEFIRLYQRNLCEFVRRLMVKRFKSSFGAFLQSPRNFKEVHKTALEFAKKTGKFIHDRRLIEKRPREYAQEPKELQTLREYHKVYEISEFEELGLTQATKKKRTNSRRALILVGLVQS